MDPNRADALRPTTVAGLTNYSIPDDNIRKHQTTNDNDFLTTDGTDNTDGYGNVNDKREAVLSPLL